MGDFLEELKRRNVIKVAVAYGVTAWLVLQVTSILMPALHLPDWTLTLVTVLLLLGFFPALILAWAYELTPEGIARDTSVDGAASGPKKARALDFMTYGALILLVIVLGLDRFVLSAPKEKDDGVEVATSSDVENKVRTSIAVLPFVNFGTPEQEYFSDGVSEELLNLLAKTKGLRVAARTSSFNFKERTPDIKTVGEMLNVETVLEGSVRWSGNRLRITAQLIDVDTGFHLWSETYDRNLTDVFEIQDEISRNIVSALKREMMGKDVDAPSSERTDIETYKLYLQAERIISAREGGKFEEASTLLDEALAIDPDYIPALTAKSNIIMLLAGTPRTAAELNKMANEAQALLDHAISIDPEDANVLTAQGFLFAQTGRDEEAVEFLQRAHRKAPNNAMALHWQVNALSRLGKDEKAREVTALARQLDPLSPILLYNSFDSAMDVGDLETARTRVQAMGFVEPRPWYFYLAMQNQLLIAEGKWGEVEPNKITGRKEGSAHEEWYARSCAALLLDCSAEAEGSAYLEFFFYTFVNPNRVDFDNLNLQGVDASWLENNFKGRQLVLKGKTQEALNFFRDIFWRDGAWSESALEISWISGNAAPYIVWCLQQTGRQEEAARLLEEALQHTAPAANGHRNPLLRMDAMHLLVLKGDPEAALALMREHQEQSGMISWYPLKMPWFDDLAETPAFKEVWLENIRLANVERARLGFPPVEPFERVGFSDM